MLFLVGFMRFETSKIASLYRQNVFWKNLKALLQCKFDDFDYFFAKNNFFEKKQRFLRNPLVVMYFKVLKTFISKISLRLKTSQNHEKLDRSVRRKWYLFFKNTRRKWKSGRSFPPPFAQNLPYFDVCASVIAWINQ